MQDENRDDRAAANHADDRRSSPGTWWRLPLLLAMVLLAILAGRWSRFGTQEHRATSPQPTFAADGKTVDLAIHFGNGQQREFKTIAWRPGITVIDLLASASRVEGGVPYVARGEGEMLMVSQIGETSNDNSAGMYWTYFVNGKLAERSAGVFELQPGDRVLWTFGKEQ